MSYYILSSGRLVRLESMSDGWQLGFDAVGNLDRPSALTSLSVPQSAEPIQLRRRLLDHSGDQLLKSHVLP